MSIIGINGSPRAEGSTAGLIGEVLGAAKEAGAQTRLFQLGRMRIAPCTDCKGCRKTAKCVVDDDMSCFYNEVESGTGPKGLVLGAPIYLDHTSAQFKCWMDRLHSYNHTELGAKMFPKGFRAVLAITYGAGNPHHYDAVLEWLCGCVENYLQAEVIERLVMASSSREPLENRAELLARARQAGKRLAGGDA